MEKNVIRLPYSLVEPGGRPSVEDVAPIIGTDNVYVLYTCPEETIAAVRVADRFAETLGVPVSVVDLRVVSFPAQMEERDGISPAETERFLDALRAEGEDIAVRVFLCRSVRQGISLAFRAHSLIVVGGHHGWRASKSDRWRRLLEAAGHYVVFVETTGHKGEMKRA